MDKFLEQVLHRLDLENNLNDESIAKLAKNLNYKEETLLAIAKEIKCKKRLQIKYWISCNNHGYIFGKDGLELIMLIDKVGSISNAAKILGISYKKAWNKIQQIEKELDREIFTKQKGAGKQGGTRLNETGKELVAKSLEFEHRLNEDAIKHYNECLKDFLKGVKK